jgi:DNA-binding transcriptional MocR family regulator
MSAQTPAPCQRRVRLGWISTPAELVDPLVARKSAADSGSPPLDQLTLVGSWHPVRTSGTSPLPAVPTGAAATSSCALAAKLPWLQVLGAAAGMQLLLALAADTDDVALAEAAAAQGINISLLSPLHLGPSPQ